MSELSAVLSSVAVPVFVPDRIIIFSSESFLFYSVSCVVTVSKHYTSGTRPPPSGFGSLFYELGSSEVRVSLDCEINRLLVSVYTWVGVIYLLLFKTDIKISFPYLCLAVKRHSPTDHRHDESYGLQV